MPYLGNNHIVGDSVNNFKVLDDISTFTATFDGSASSVVSTAAETIKVVDHRFVNGQRVTYNNGGGSNIGGLSSGTAYYVIYDTAHTIKLATNESNAASLTAINLNAVGGGTSHTLNAAFDGVNKKFRVTHGNGNRPRFHHATQLSIAINNVVQRPNNDANNFTEGYAVEIRDIIVFKTAPTVNDIFFGSLTGETRGTFEISDHKIDNYTGDGSTVEYTLSQNVPNAESLLVSLNGVIQHPTDASTARSYSLLTDNVITFTTAPALGVEIQIRHLGFAGASSGDVSGFYGRTGNVGLTSTDHITTGDISARNIVATGIATFGSSSTVIDGDANTIKVGTALTLGHTQGLQFHTQNLHSTGFEINNINASGIITASQFVGNIGGNPTFSGDATFNGSVSIGGTLTYEDVTNIDSVGIVTARDGLKVLAGGANIVGVVTANTFKGDGDFVELDVDGHTNLDNVSIAGVTTASGNINMGGGNLIFGDSGGDSDDKLIFGAGSDLKIYHGSDISTINDSYGDLRIMSNTLRLQRQAGGENFLYAIEGGKVSLFYDGSQKFETSDKGIKVGTGVTIETNGQATFSGIITATSIVGDGTSGIKLPVGTTAQRDNTQGMLRYNSTLELPEYYNGSAWVAIDSPPLVSSVSPTEVESAAGGNITFTITGERFGVGATVKLISNTGVELTPSPVTRVSSAQLTAVIARNSFVNAQEPYDVKVINASGLSSTLADQINVDNAPTWNTSAGTLATINDLATGTHATISATDADGDTVAYSIVSGSIPAGTSLNSATGAISGDPTDVSSSTTSSFTVRATAGGKTADRSFAIVVNPVNDGTSSARAATSAKAIYTAGYATSGKAIKYIDFGGSVGVKQVWCDFDTADASGGKGWMLCAKFTEASQWNGRDNDIRTTNAYIDPGDGYGISCNMADANMNMMRITVEDSANQALGSSADADWYYEWTTTLPWKAVWQPTAGTGGGATHANGDLIYSSSSGGSGPRRTSIRKFQKSHNIKHNYTNSNHKFNNISDFANNQSDTYVAAGSGVYGGDYHTKPIGGSDAPANGIFDFWYALTTNNQIFRIHYIGRSATYFSRSSPDTDGTIGMLANGSTKTHTGQDQDNECNVKIGYDDDHLWQHIDTNPNNTGGTYANRNTNASGKNMYWWIK